MRVKSTCRHRDSIAGPSERWTSCSNWLPVRLSQLPCRYNKVGPSLVASTLGTHQRPPASCLELYHDFPRESIRPQLGQQAPATEHGHLTVNFNPRGMDWRAFGLILLKQLKPESIEKKCKFHRKSNKTIFLTSPKTNVTKIRDEKVFRYSIYKRET